MDASRFDHLSRVLAAAPTRRTALAGLAALLGRGLVAPDETAAQSRICRPLGDRCFPNRGLDCCRGECRSGRCRCPKGQHRCGNRCVRNGRRCRRRARPRRGCPAGKQRCQGRCIAKQACCGGCAAGQVCRHGGCCDVTTASELHAALAPGGPDTIRLCPKTTYRGKFAIARPVTVIGAGATSSVLDGAGSGPVVTITNPGSEDIQLRGLSVVNGVANRGGGIQSMTYSSLTLVDTVVARNRATGNPEGGGGISIEWSGANVTLRGSSRVEDNKATGDNSQGGGIYASVNSSVTLLDQSQLRRNEAMFGGGLYLSIHSSAKLHNDSRIEANTAQNRGGGVYNSSATWIRLHDRSVIRNNRALGGADAGGGIFASDALAVDLPNQAMVHGNTPDQCEPNQPTGDGGTCE